MMNQDEMFLEFWLNHEKWFELPNRKGLYVCLSNEDDSIELQYSHKNGVLNGIIITFEL